RGDSPFQNLTWTVEGSAIAGWKQLVGGPADLASKVQGAAFWEHIWGRSAPRTEFHSRPWPPSSFAELAALRPEELSAAGGNLNVKTEDGNRPGGLPSLLSAPAPE